MDASTRKEGWQAVCADPAHHGQGWYGKCRASNKEAKKDADQHHKETGHEVEIAKCYNVEP
jgi:hypothetical protein